MCLTVRAAEHWSFPRADTNSATKSRYEIKDGTVSIDFTDDKVRDISYEFTVGSDELTLERKEKNDTIIHKFKKQTHDRSE